MWDFTHMFIPIISPLRMSLYLSMGYEQVLLFRLALWVFSSSTRCPWASHTPSMWIMCQRCMLIHRNPARPYPWEPRTTPLFSTISNIHLLGSFFSSPRSLCVGRLGFFFPGWVGTMNTSPPSPHTTMGSDITCRGDKHLGELPWVINITYRDTI